MACQPGDCVRGASFEPAKVAGSAATELAIRQKDNLLRALEDSHCHPSGQCENIGHVSPEAAAGGAIGLVEKGDTATICIGSVASIWL
jgi:Dehydratase family